MLRGADLCYVTVCITWMGERATCIRETCEACVLCSTREHIFSVPAQMRSRMCIAQCVALLIRGAFLVDAHCSSACCSVRPPVFRRRHREEVWQNMRFPYPLALWRVPKQLPLPATRLVARSLSPFNGGKTGSLSFCDWNRCLSVYVRVPIEMMVDEERWGAPSYPSALRLRTNIKLQCRR